VSNRRNRPVNRWGCKPTEDVCVEHDLPLECRHGCRCAAAHSCKERTDRFADNYKGGDEPRDIGEN
jgi:hypothetical protein